MYIADAGNHRIRRVTLDGTINTIAGNGAYGFAGDGDSATSATLAIPVDVAVAADGSIYIADQDNGRVRRVGTDGRIHTVAGGGAMMTDGIPATSADIGRPVSVTIGPEGSLYISDDWNHRILRVTPDGLIRRVAGNLGSGFAGDGGPATAAQIDGPRGIAIGRDGSLFIADRNNHRIRRTDPSGTITTVAGRDCDGFPFCFGGYSGDGGPAPRAELRSPGGVAVGVDGFISIADTNNFAFRRTALPLPGFSLTDILLPSSDGSELYLFTPDGRHHQTLDALTGSLRWEFAYDTGLLVAVTDGNGNTTEIERDGNGMPLALVAPFGQRTLLGFDGNGYLETITNPASEAINFTYTADGLLTELEDARHHHYFFEYDELGRLTRDEDPAGGFQDLDRTGDSTSYEVGITTAEGRSTHYSVERIGTGEKQLVTVHPDGHSSQTTRGTDGAETAVSRDASTHQLLHKADPRFGMQAPIVSERVESTPLGLMSTALFTRSVLLTNPPDPLSIESQTDTFSINGNPPSVSTRTLGSSSTLDHVSATGRTSTTTFDDRNRVTKTEVAGLYPVRRSYDIRGRLATLKHGPDPDTSETRTTQFAYKDTTDDQNGLLDTTTDATGRVTQFAYDSAGRVTTQTFSPGTADERAIAYDYDANGNLTSVTPPGRPAHTSAYTPVNLESAYVPPDVVVNPETTYTYNLDRQITQIARPDGQAVNFGYDSGGRLQTVVLPASDVRTYTYDPTTGQLQAVTGPDATLTFTHDGSLLTSETWSGDVDGIVTHTYDNNFRQTALQVNSETAIPFGYDYDGLLTNAGALTLTRDGDNGFVTATSLDLSNDAWGLSAFGELESYGVEVDSSLAYEVSFIRDKLGRITERTESVLGEASITTKYEYDPSGRLWRVKDAVDAVLSEYLYDANGNRIEGSFSEHAGSVLDTAHDDQDRLVAYETGLLGVVTFTSLLSKLRFENG